MFWAGTRVLMLVLVQASGGQGASGELGPLAGHVWQKCETLHRRPGDDCTAIVRNLSTQAKAVKDALREMRATISENEARPA